MSFACIHVPNFSLQAAIRADESLRDQAVAIFDGIFPLLTVIALSPEAAQKGLHLGMTKTQAELFDVRLLHRSRAQEATTHQALLDCGLAISPRVEDTHAPPLKGIGDIVILDTEGLGRLYRSPEKLARKIRRVARQLNLNVNIGIAANPEAAALAAQGFGGVTIIPPGAESKCLGPLPVEILQISAELQETFTTWGIQTLHALSSLPEVGLIKRLGQEGKRLQDLARGVYQRILVPIESELKFEECMELETSIELLEPLTFILARLLRQLCARLLARSLATNEVRLVLELEELCPVISRDPLLSTPAVEDPPPVPPCTRGDNSGVSDPPAPTGREGGTERQVRGHHRLMEEPTEQATQEQSPLRHSTVLNLPVPTYDSKILLKLLQLDLESRPPVAPVCSVFLKAEATSPRIVQRELFEPSGPEPEKLEITLARIAVIVGKDRVGSPVLRNTHKPDSFQLKKFLPLAAGNVSRNSQSPPLKGKGAVRPRGMSPSEHGCKLHERHLPIPSSQEGIIHSFLSNVVPLPDMKNSTENSLDKREAILPRSSLRRFRPPIPVKVKTESATPVVVFFRHERQKVLECAGPWRINGDWWTDAPWAREEWDVTLSQQSNRTDHSKFLKVIQTQETVVFRIYQDLRTRQWFMEGMYD
jgi:nucleotidyltransferase/DNA polymerase involved in DNA repair